MIFYIIATALCLIAAVIIFVMTRDEDFRIERSVSIDAPPQVVFPIINDFHQWDQWSPWEKRDPQMTKTFAGPATGRGAVYTWAGNKHVGEGRMTVLESTPNALILMKLEFIKPFAATNKTTFALTPVDGGTKVDWIMEGKKNFMAKIAHLVMDMDKLIGKDFAAGLANLNTIAQSKGIAEPVAQ